MLALFLVDSEVIKYYSGVLGSITLHCVFPGCYWCQVLGEVELMYAVNYKKNTFL